jgi:hypothetical protein
MTYMILNYIVSMCIERARGSMHDTHPPDNCDDETMSQTIDTFAEECHAILKTGASNAHLEQVRVVVEKHLSDPTFVSAHLGPDNQTSRTILYEDSELEFCICAHVYKGASEAPPHDHGPTWAVYGQAAGQTVMTEYEQVKAPQGDAPGTVRSVKSYDLDPGMAVAYPTGQLHAPKREDDTRLIRIEGKDLMKVSRDSYVMA